MCFLRALSCVHMLEFLEPGNPVDNAFVAPALPAKALLSKACFMPLPLAVSSNWNTRQVSIAYIRQVSDLGSGSMKRLPGTEATASSGRAACSKPLVTLSKLRQLITWIAV